MNPNDLQIIMDALGKLGEAGADAFTLWLLTTEVLPTLVWGSVVFGISWLAYKMTITLNTIAAASAETDAFLREARDHFRIGCGGSLAASERDRTIAALRKMLAAKPSQGT